MSPTSAVDQYLPILLSLWAQPNARTAIILVVAAGVFAIATAGMGKKSTGYQQRDKPLPTFRTRGPRRFPWYRKPVIPLSLGPVTIDLQPTMTDTLHTLIDGSTRTGKSTSVLPLFDLPIGVLCIALDITYPIEEKVRAVGGTIWTNDPDECSIGLDVFGGHARIASEGLVAGFPKSAANIGDQQRSARTVIWNAFDVMDATGQPRTLAGVIDALLQPIPDIETQRACRSWARKLNDLSRIMGHTFGGDLDVVSEMRRGNKVLLRLNHFLSPDDAPFIAGLLLVHASRVMEDAHVPFILIIEEAGQAALAQAHLSPIAQAGAARGVPTIAITQNASTLPIEVRNNFAVTVAFALEDSRERSVAADRLELDSDQLRRSAFPDNGKGWAYVRAPGLTTTLVHIQQQKPPKTCPTRHPYENRPTPLIQEPPTRPTVIIEAIGQTAPVYPMLPPPPLAVQELLDKIERQGDCWIWTGAKDKDGYGLHRWDYPDGRPRNNRPAHQVVWEVVNGRWFPVGPDGKTMEFDHRRSCSRLCVNPGHGEPKPKRSNILAMHRTRGHATAAD